jgi:hypothetical protein
LLQLLGALAELAVLRLQVTAWTGGTGRRGAAGQTVLAVGDLQPPGEAGLRDPGASGDLRDRLIALAGHRDHVTPELRRERFGHDADPSSEAAASQARSQPNRGQSPLKCNTACVRPDHLEVVDGPRPVVSASSIREPIPQLENCCRRGHPKTPENLGEAINPDGSVRRWCIPCRAATNKRWQSEVKTDDNRERAGSNQYAGRTHCKHGHELSEDNITLRSDGSRLCKQCKLDRQKRSREKLKADRAA